MLCETHEESEGPKDKGTLDLNSVTVAAVPQSEADPQLWTGIQPD